MAPPAGGAMRFKEELLRVKAESHRTRAEVHGPGSAKTEPRVKSELASARVAKAELKAKAELRAKKEESEDEAEAKSRIKRLKSEKTEPGVKGEAGTRHKLEPGAGSASDVTSLIKRGLKLRALAEKAKALKREQGGRKVKVEKGKKGKARLKTGTKRRKGTAKRRKASREAIKREVTLSEELSEVVGAPSLSRPEAVKRLWAYCRERGMLNPDDKREIIFDASLKKMLGKPRARMCDLTSLLVPHLDYSSPPAAKTEAKSEVNVKVKRKHESSPGRAKAEVPAHAVKKQEGERRTWSKLEHPTKHEAENVTEVANHVPAKWKREVASKAESGLKRELLADALSSLVEGAEPGLKRELSADALSSLVEGVRSTKPRLSSIARTSVRVGCTCPSGDFELQAVAAPVCGAGSAARSLPSACPTLRKPFSIELMEGSSGSFEAHAEVQLTGLNPEVAYRISIDAVGGSLALPVTSHLDVVLPQRADPSRWTPQEAAQWCASMQVPEFTQKSREYGIDGATLMALGEEDLRALGLVVPFMLRRVLAGLETLRAP